MILKLRQVKFLLLILFFSLPVYFFIGHILSDYRLMNEYKYFDEVTLLDDGQKIDNLNYINKNLLFDPSDTYKYSSQDIIFKGTEEPSFNAIPRKHFIVPSYFSSENMLAGYSTFEGINFSNKLGVTSAQFDVFNKNNFTKQIDSNRTSDIKEYPIFHADTKEKLEEKFNFFSRNIFEQNMHPRYARPRNIILS